MSTFTRVRRIPLSDWTRRKEASVGSSTLVEEQTSTKSTSPLAVIARRADERANRRDWETEDEDDEPAQGLRSTPLIARARLQRLQMSTPKVLGAYASPARLQSPDPVISAARLAEAEQRAPRSRSASLSASARRLAALSASTSSVPGREEDTRVSCRHTGLAEPAVSHSAVRGGIRNRKSARSRPRCSSADHAGGCGGARATQADSVASRSLPAPVAHPHRLLRVRQTTARN